MQTVETLIAELGAGVKPSNSQLKRLMYSLHDALVNNPIMLWLAVSFEDMGDVVSKAMKCIEGDEMDRAEERELMERRFCQGRSIIAED